MELKDQVCSLELSKKLNKLGVKQDSWLYWIKTDGAYGYFLFEKKDFPEWCKIEETYSAFTVAELGEMLPHKVSNIKGDEREARLKISKGKILAEWIVSYGIYAFNECLTLSHIETAKTETKSRAKMLIYLIENKLITPSKN